MSDYRDGSVIDLRGALDRAIAEINEGQTVLAVAKDKADGALGIMQVATEESIRDETGAAKAALVDASAKIDEAIVEFITAIEQITNYQGTL